MNLQPAWSSYTMAYEQRKWFAISSRLTGVVRWAEVQSLVHGRVQRMTGMMRIYHVITMMDYVGLDLLLWGRRRRRTGSRQCPADGALCRWRGGGGTLDTHVTALCRLVAHLLHAHRALRSTYASATWQHLENKQFLSDAKTADGTE